jgi:formylglycine-generating enzyme required for sulfatase activity
MDKARIFISYAREDERAVRRLYLRLDGPQFQPWMDKFDLLPGENWRPAIEEAICSADFVIVCLSKTWETKRGFLQRELKVALDQWQEKFIDDIYIIPAKLEPCKLPDELSGFQSVDLFDEDQWPQLIRSLHEGMRRQGKIPGAQPRPESAPSQQPTGKDPIPYVLLLSQLADRLRITDQPVQSSDAPPLRPYRFETVRMDARGRIVERREGRAQCFVEDLGHGVTLEMVEIPGGTFLMGTSEAEAQKAGKERKRYGWDEKWIDKEMPQHRVNVPSFFIGKFQVTQAQWRVVAELPKVKIKLEPDPSKFKGDDLPVESVSWEEAKEFCARLSRLTRSAYRLPSEAEWEYACRAGTTTPFAFGETITPQVVNYNGEYPYASAPKSENRKKTVPVGSLGIANGFGVYDMHGNVWEWCEDHWHDSYNGAPSDGGAWTDISATGSYRVFRGGGWYGNAVYCRSAYRSYGAPGFRDDGVGFRLVRIGR